MCYSPGSAGEYRTLRISALPQSYVTDLVIRDVRQISDIERPAEMRRLLSVVGARMGTLAVAQSMANDISLPRRTLSR